MTISEDKKNALLRRAGLWPDMTRAPYHTIGSTINQQTLMQADNIIKLYETARATIVELRKERDQARQLCFNAHDRIIEMQHQINSQRRHIEELEKQLEHVAPGLPDEVREFLQSTEDDPS